MHAVLAVLSSLAQISTKALSAGEPRISDEPSSVFILLLGGLFCFLVLFFAFKTAKRNHVNE